MMAKWRLILLMAPLGVLLALFQNCGQNTRQIRVAQEITTPGGLVAEKPLDVLTFGTSRAHVDLSEPLSANSEITLEMVSYTENEGAEIAATNKSKNLLVFPLSLEGICPSTESFFDSPEDISSAIAPGSGYLIRDAVTQKFAYLLFTGFTGEAKENSSELNLIQLSFILVTPKAGVDLNGFMSDICGEPPLAMGPGFK